MAERRVTRPVLCAPHNYAQLAATVPQHDVTRVTRNVSDFKRMGSGWSIP